MTQGGAVAPNEKKNGYTSSSVFYLNPAAEPAFRNVVALCKLHDRRSPEEENRYVCGR